MVIKLFSFASLKRLFLTLNISLKHYRPTSSSNFSSRYRCRISNRDRRSIRLRWTLIKCGLLPLRTRERNLGTVGAQTVQQSGVLGVCGPKYEGKVTTIRCSKRELGWAGCFEQSGPVCVPFTHVAFSAGNGGDYGTGVNVEILWVLVGRHEIEIVEVYDLTAASGRFRGNYGECCRCHNICGGGGGCSFGRKRGRS